MSLEKNNPPSASDVVRSKPVTLTIKLPMEGKPEKDIAPVVYAFTRSGTLLAQTPLKDGMAKLTLHAQQAMSARIVVAPQRPDTSKEQEITLQDMERMRAYEPAWNFNPRQLEYELLPIPELSWKWWLRCSCRVRGKVVRPISIGGVTHELPVCNARVHICEVDRLSYVIPRLPDLIIDRIRKELLEQIEWPQPPIPIPDPAPFQFDPGIVDPSPEQLARLNLRTQSGLGSGLDAVAFNPQPDPPRIAALARASATSIRQPLALPAALQTVLASSSIAAARQSLALHIDVLRPYICRWPWLWPYACTCDELAVVTTDHNGRFDRPISYPCFGDKPDLYFWIEYCIGGVWTTVHRPLSVCCHTCWDYVCGSEVTLRVNDPRVPWCGEQPPLPGKQVAVLSLGHGVSMTEIRRQTAGSGEGLTTDGRPFGGSVEPHVWFGDGLLASGISHYRWSYRRLGAGIWTPMDQDVVRHYGEIMADTTLTFKPFPIGPDTAFAGQNVFKIRPLSPPLNPGAVSSSWAPEVDARSNTASAYFPTHLLSGGNALAGAGKYELKLELFRVVAGVPQLVNLSDEGVLLKVPAVAAPFGVGTVPTRAVPTDGAYAFDPMEERVIRDGAGKIVAFRVVIHVDNNPCQAEIFQVWADNPANLAGPCGFIEYANKTTSLAHVSFKAHHPNQFARFSFTTVKGSTGAVAVASVANAPVGVPVGLFANNAATGVFNASIPVNALLDANGHVCTKAAFGETLHVAALATDGWGILTYLDRSGTPKAFALEPNS